MRRLVGMAGNPYTLAVVTLAFAGVVFAGVVASNRRRIARLEHPTPQRIEFNVQRALMVCLHSPKCRRTLLRVVVASARSERRRTQDGKRSGNVVVPSVATTPAAPSRGRAPTTATAPKRATTTAPKRTATSKPKRPSAPTSTTAPPSSASPPPSSSPPSSPPPSTVPSLTVPAPVTVCTPLLAVNC